MNITNLYQLKPIFYIQFFIVFNRPCGNHQAVIPPISRSHVAPLAQDLCEAGGFSRLI